MTILTGGVGARTLDNFNDQSLSEWDGATASWSHSTTTVEEGAASVYQVDSSSAGDAIRRLDVTVSQGQTLQMFAQVATNSVPNGRVAFAYGNQGAGNAGDAYDGWSCYSVEIDYEDGHYQLNRQDNGVGGAASIIANDGTTGVVTGEWVRIVLEWANDGTHTAWFYDSTGAQLTQISGTDTTYTSGGIGLFTDDDINNIEQRADYITVGATI